MISYFLRPFSLCNFLPKKQFCILAQESVNGKPKSVIKPFLHKTNSKFPLLCSKMIIMPTLLAPQRIKNSNKGRFVYKMAFIFRSADGIMVVECGNSTKVLFPHQIFDLVINFLWKFNNNHYNDIENNQISSNLIV